MKGKLLAVGALLLAFTPLAARACPEGIPGSLAYIRRDENRCEGLLDREVTDTFDLISFATSDLEGYPEMMSIRVPGVAKYEPRIEVQSLFRNYRLDNLKTTPGNAGAFFSLNTNVLETAEIPIASLRATARVIRESTLVYFPVILGEASDRYEFVLYSPRRVTFPTLEIRHNGRVVASDPREIPDAGQIRFTWNPDNAPAGEYELHVVDGEGYRRVFQFRHDPNWL